ncbi:MAG: tetratricopeptide repeat protein [Candidatus Binataceae bacterium]
MNASETPPPPRGANRRVRTLVLRRQDHIGDTLGLAFLEAPESAGEAILARVRGYLGAKVKILKAEISRDRIEVEVESRGWPDEAARLAAAARDLGQKGARRNAESMFREAIAIDPLNSGAMAGYGLALAAQERDAEALDALRRAREFGADGAELLIAMGQCAARLDRRTTALGYFEQALKLEPKNFVARRAMKALGRIPQPASAQDAAAQRNKRN